LQNGRKEKIIQKVKKIPYLTFNYNNKEKANENIQDNRHNNFKIEKRFPYSINKESKEINKIYHNILLKKIPFIIEQKFLKRKNLDNIQPQKENEKIIKNG